MQAIFRGAYWLRFWSLLQHEDTKETICSAIRTLEIVALDIFAKNGWRSNNKLCFKFFSYYVCSFHFNLCILRAYAENDIRIRLCASQMPELFLF
jgi:hypothetical protein